MQPKTRLGPEKAIKPSPTTLGKSETDTRGRTPVLPDNLALGGLKSLARLNVPLHLRLGLLRLVWPSFESRRNEVSERDSR